MQPVDPDNELVEIICNGEAASAISHSRRTLDDLPDIPASVNPVNVVLCYEMFGLDDFAIAEAVNLPLETVRNIRRSEIFATMKSAVTESLIENARTSVQGVLNTHALTAANKLAQHAARSERAGDEITAATQILDRTGHSAKSITEHRLKLDDELVINYTKRERQFEGVTIDVNPSAAVDSQASDLE